MEYIYVLRLEQGKFYVGKSTDVERRLQQHISGNGGSSWTHRYRPIRLEKKRKAKGITDEDAMVKEYMFKHGIDNVRGGTYSQMNLTDSQRDHLEQERRGASDACFKCGGTDHFASECPESDDDDNMNFPAVESDPYLGCPQIPAQGSTRGCVRCGRDSHSVEDCYASVHADGTPLVAVPASDSARRDLQGQERQGVSDLCCICGFPNHTSIQCPYKPPCNSQNRNSRPTKRPKEADHVCSRCGRDSHSVDNCYATIHTSGTPLLSVPAASSKQELILEHEQRPVTFAKPPTTFPVNAYSQGPESFEPPDFTVKSEISRTTKRPRGIAGRACGRCGRDSHSTTDCFATTHADGTALLAISADSARPAASTSIDHGTGGGFETAVCDRCGRKGHLATQCYAKTAPHSVPSRSTHAASTIENSCDREGHTASQCYARYAAPASTFRPPTGKPKRSCNRCGREGHTASQCYAQSAVTASSARPTKQKGDGCKRCGREGHSASQCYAGSAAPASTSRPAARPKSSCNRCGREGHTASQCYARI